MYDRKKRKDRIRFYATTVLLVLLIFFSSRNPSTSKLPSRILNTAVAPINSLFYSVSQSAYKMYDKLFGDKADQVEIRNLREENIKLKSMIDRLGLVINESEILKGQSELRKINQDKLIEANVSASDTGGHYVRFILNKGSLSGIKQGDIVMVGNKSKDEPAIAGLVGKVYEVGLNYAKVSSILDMSNNISAIFAESGGYGIINDRDKEDLFGYLLDPQTPVKEGEDVLTSGIGGVYPRGILIGKVTKISSSEDGLTKNVSVKTSVDFNRLYRLLVMHVEDASKVKLEEEAR